jgi:hypothetical protein
MVDKLKKRWPNCGRYRLCNKIQETASHLLSNCMLTIRISSNAKNRLGLNDVDLKRGGLRETTSIGNQAMTSLAMLISWEFGRK